MTIYHNPGLMSTLISLVFPSNTAPKTEARNSFFKLMTTPFDQQALHQCCNHAKLRSYSRLTSCVDNLNQEDLLEKLKKYQEDLTNVRANREDETVQHSLLHFSILLKVHEVAQTILDDDDKSCEQLNLSKESILRASSKREEAIQKAANSVTYHAGFYTK